MTIDYIVGLALAVLLLVYLTYALLKPEKF
jgi:K+-transporting ATPase KdpF subunit